MKKKIIYIQVCRRKQLQFQFPPCMYFIGCNKMFHSLTVLIGLILVSALCSPSQRTRLIVTWTRVNASRYFDDLQPSLTENKWTKTRPDVEMTWDMTTHVTSLFSFHSSVSVVFSPSCHFFFFLFDQISFTEFQILMWMLWASGIIFDNIILIL